MKKTLLWVGILIIAVILITIGLRKKTAPINDNSLVINPEAITTTTESPTSTDQPISSSKNTMNSTSAENKTITTASGLQYEILKKGTGTVRPTLSSVVKVNYHGTLLDGTVFDSSIDRGQPIEFPLNGVIKGWQEGLQLMHVGDTFKFTIPANLAYGNASPSSKIPANSTLVFTVELLDIK